MNLLLTGAFKYSKEHLDLLKSSGYNIIFVQDERLPVKEDVSKIEAVICNGLFLYNDIAFFKNLKFIQLTSAGMDRVPLEYIKEKGIQICNARGVYSVPMAEWAVLKILEIYKKSKCFYKSQKSRLWEKQRDLFELSGKTAAVIGFGSVGNEIAKRLKAFDVKIICVDIIKIESELIDESYLINDMDIALGKSDILILSLPLNESTKHLLNEEKISKIPDRCVLINISRGGVIDELALTEAIRNNKFLGVALDVFEIEPLPSDSPLWDFEKVTITPHNSFVSDKVNERLFELIVNNLNQFKKSL